ncbi:MAG: efflux RND transporter permease subunit, partial [Clostridia bacterium]|nr:efflux RND transporter permease subunit [Clostridia bacterium]
MLSKLSVKKPLTIVAIVIIIIVLGIVSYQSTTIDMLPELELPYVVVATIYGGASPELVEKEITTPIEQSIAKVSGIQSIMSISQENASLVICELTFKSDVGNVMTEIDRAVGLVTLPESPALFDPMILQFSINEAPIMYVSIARKGYSLEESTEYLANIINKLDGVPGVAKANADGLISNLALINLDSGTTTESITDYFTALAGVELELPDTVKQEVRTDLQTLLENAQENPELITEGELDASKVLDHLIIPYIEEKLAEIEDPDNPDSTRYEMIYEKLEEELKNPNSAARKTLIRALQSLLDSAYILEEGEENEAVFNELLDDTFSETVKGVISYYTEGLTAMVSADLLQQVVFAQDFTMPAGNIDIGAGSYVVKVGDSIASRDELYHMPVVSMDLSAQIKEYIGYVQTALTLVSVASGDGKASFNSNDLMLLSEAIASALERTTDYAVWAVDALTTDQRDSYLNMDESAKAEWAELINADSGFQMLIADYDETLPVNWRSNVLNYIKDHNLFPPDGSLVASPTYWDEEYNTHYAELLQAEIIETEQELPQTIEEYADFIITTATVTGNILYPLDDADKQYWKDYMVGNGNFRECVDDMTTDYDWRKTIIKCVVDYTIFPQNHTNTNWTIEKVDFYRTALRTRLELMDLNRPQDAGGYAEFVVDTLRTPNIFDPFYFNGDLRDNWIEKLSESTSFAHFANGITVAKNWQRVILSYVYENRETLFPTGMTLTGVKYWDETAQAAYETR